MGLSSKKKEELLFEMQDLLEQRKILKARSSFKDFCEYVIKDERSGTKIKIAELQKSWIDHIGFCKANGLNALILAPMGHGKCVDPETPFVTKKGLVLANALRVGDEVLSFDQADGKAVWTDIRAIETQAPKLTYEVVVEGGHRLKCTHDHKFLCRGRTGFEWVKASDLAESDSVVIPADWVKDTGTSSDYYWEGLVYYGTETPPNYMDTKRLLENLEGTEVCINRTKLEYNKLIEFTTPYEATSPFLLSRRELTSFLSGVFDAMGFYNSSLRTYELEYKNKATLQEIQTLLLGIGIRSRLVRRIRPNSIKYSLLIEKYQVGTVTSLLDGALCMNHKGAHGTYKTVKYGSYITEKVLSVVALGNQPTIGIETGNHLHVTGGVVTHNTQIVSIALPLYLLGKDPSTRIKMVCLADDAGKERMSSIKAYLQDDEDYARVFPNVKKDRESEWSKRNLTIVRPTMSKDPSLSVKGVTSGGIGGRCDVLLVDDIFDYKTAIAQPATREQICATFKLVWMSRIDEGGMAVVICTRWHEMDLAGEILADPLMRDQYGILIQAINSDLSGVDIKVIVPDHLEEKYMTSVSGFFSATNPILSQDVHGTPELQESQETLRDSTQTAPESGHRFLLG